MTIFVHDTFTGALGALSAHTGEIGASWSSPFGSGLWIQPLSQARLDGSGNLELGYSSHSAEDMMPSGIPQSPDYYAEVDFNVVGIDGSNLDQINIYLRAVNSSTVYVIEFYPAAGTVGSSYSSMYFQGTSYLGPVGGSAYIGTHTLRAEIEGTAMRAFVDGVQIGGDATVARETTAGRLAFGIGSDFPSASTGLKILEIRAGDLSATPPPEPGAFWTILVDSTERI